MKDGGNAFPYTQYGGFTEPGMTLRDWFAGQALAGFASLERDTSMKTEAKLAYKYADAMIAAREQADT